MRTFFPCNLPAFYCNVFFLRCKRFHVLSAVWYSSGWFLLLVGFKSMLFLIGRCFRIAPADGSVMSGTRIYITGSYRAHVRLISGTSPAKGSVKLISSGSIFLLARFREAAQVKKSTRFDGLIFGCGRICAY